MPPVEAHTPELIHYTPILTTVLSAAFVAGLLARARTRKWPPHLMWWAIGVFFYGVGTALESSITLFGNTEALNRLWYWAGAILGGYPLATGSVYLLLRRRPAHVLTGVTLAYVAAVSVLVFVAPIDPGKLLGHKPTGRGLFDWTWMPWLTVAINLYALVFLVGGALWSSARFFLTGSNRGRAIGTGLIAFGALLPGIGGAATKAGYVEALYVGEFVGLVFIVVGYWICLKSPAPAAASAEPLAREDPPDRDLRELQGESAAGARPAVAR